RVYADNTAVGGATGSSLSVSRTGERFLVDAAHAYSSSFSSLGTLSAGETLTAGVITQDGKRVYAYADSGKLYAFDLDTFGVGGIQQVAGSPIMLSNTVGNSPVMTVSVDGRTVFIAGDDRVIVQPAPP
ncbi:MAG TPA: hypothetical protein VHH11_01165, partial [Gammaproteobacteria bacterium]|nr:hypothetical protein [Gammaproteobacteria bacterium]